MDSADDGDTASPATHYVSTLRFPTPRITLATAFQNETFLKAYHEFEIAGM